MSQLGTYPFFKAIFFWDKKWHPHHTIDDDMDDNEWVNFFEIFWNVYSLLQYMYNVLDTQFHEGKLFI